jgi:hypothetical protein
LATVVARQQQQNGVRNAGASSSTTLPTTGLGALPTTELSDEIDKLEALLYNYDDLRDEAWPNTGKKSKALAALSQTMHQK